MCAILGMLGYVREGQWCETYHLLRELFLASEHRGMDATGFVAQKAPLDNPFAAGTVLAKAPIQASQFVDDNPVFQRLRHQRCSVFLGHVRAATHGSPTDNRNNHPHFSHDGLYLVHNGIAGNYRELADQYDLRMESQCDSEIILRLVESAEHPAMGLDLALREVQGSMAVALHDQRSGLVWLARNSGRPLWLARLMRDRRWFFASTGTILLESFRRILGKNVQLDYFAPIPEDTPVAISTAGMVIAPLSSASR